MNLLETQKEKVASFIKTHSFGVIATNSANGLAPESAVVAFSETELLEIIFGSFSSTRKNQNIRLNPSVSFVIGWDNTDKTTIQIEGKAVLLEGAERETLEQAHCKKNPESTKYLSDPRQEYFKIIPHFLRYSNFSVDPQEVWELALPHV